MKTRIPSHLDHQRFSLVPYLSIDPSISSVHTGSAYLMYPPTPLYQARSETSHPMKGRAGALGALQSEGMCKGACYSCFTVHTCAPWEWRRQALANLEATLPNKEGSKVQIHEMKL